LEEATPARFLPPPGAWRWCCVADFGREAWDGPRVFAFGETTGEAFNALCLALLDTKP
jgi:hypothetical protein